VFCVIWMLRLDVRLYKWWGIVVLGNFLCFLGTVRTRSGKMRDGAGANFIAFIVGR